jgi:hypothetical protein
MHISPLDSFLHSFENLSLCFPHCFVYMQLLFSKLSVYRKSDCLIGAVTIPASSHIVENHLTRLYDFVVVYEMQCGTVSSTRTNRIESQKFAARFISMIEIKQSVKLNLQKTWLGMPHHSQMGLRRYPTHISHNLDLVRGFYGSKIAYNRK